jgi:PEP-CTERM putative exosortase interaction domain
MSRNETPRVGSRCQPGAFDMNKLIAAAAVAALSIAGSAQASELLANGTFDAGNIDFQSGYAYAATHDLYPAGTYDIITNPQADHSSFSAFADHTPGADTGLMMVINGSGVADTIVWGQGTPEAPLIGAAGTGFTFSFWLASVYPDSPASLNLVINGQTLEGVSFNALGGQENLGVWQNFTYSGVSGAQGITSIALTNSNLEPNGNDFALDDLSLQGTAVPEPTSWALMLMGFGGLGAMLRSTRRRLVFAAA